MVTTSKFNNLLNERFFKNFIPIPATSNLRIGQIAPDFLLPDITNQSTIQLSHYFGKQPIILAFTRIFTEKNYCPLCYPHIKELNEHYEQFTQKGVQVLMITSTDNRQSRQVVDDLGMKMPLLSNPSCDTFRLYQTGQALGAPLPAQFLLDVNGKIRYKHLFSFLSPNAKTETLLKAVDNLTGD